MAYKMALVVRTDLGMGKGKIAAQCGHAVGRLILAGINTKPDLITKWLGDTPPEKKIVLKVDSEKELIDLGETCLKADIAFTVIADAGRTQVKPGSVTVLGIGPNSDEKIDQIIGHLKLL